MYSLRTARPLHYYHEFDIETSYKGGWEQRRKQQNDLERINYLHIVNNLSVM